MRYPGYDGDVTPRIYVTCTQCHQRFDRANVLAVGEDGAKWRHWRCPDAPAGES